MANKNFKGRKKGAVNNTTIKDPVLDPFFLVKDQYGYIVNETLEVGNEKDNNKKEKVKAIGYFGTFDSALKEIAQGKLNIKRKSYESLDEYIQEWKDITTQFKTIIKF